MVIKILSSSASFKGISYNTDKIDKNKGELMVMANLGAIQAMDNPKPEDLKNYLKALSAQNKRVTKPQFHAIISAKGKEYDKQALTEIATQWLAKMGYEKQPYIIVFHKDTDNNHVHIVSTRIDRNGKKISSGFENIRAMQNLNQVLGIDEKYSAKADIDNALTYQFSTKFQFMMILESKGYTLNETNGSLEVIKFGVKQAAVDLALVAHRIKSYAANQGRKNQLKAIFHKYAAVYDTALKPNATTFPGGGNKKNPGLTSDFSFYLKDKLGITLIFHSAAGKPPYGYSVIDHSAKLVIKGGEIMALKDMLAMSGDEQYQAEKSPYAAKQEISDQTKDYYAAILKAALHNFPDFVQGLQHLGIKIINKGEEFYVADEGAQIFINIDELLDEGGQEQLIEAYGQYREVSGEFYRQYQDIPQVFIAPDIDDEAIHGRNRRRKKKARTNSR